MATNAEISELKTAIEKLTAEVGKKKPFLEVAGPYIAMTVPLIMIVLTLMTFMSTNNALTARVAALEVKVDSGFKDLTKAIGDLNVSIAKLEVRNTQETPGPAPKAP